MTAKTWRNQDIQDPSEFFSMQPLIQDEQNEATFKESSSLSIFRRNMDIHPSSEPKQSALNRFHDRSGNRSHCSTYKPYKLLCIKFFEDTLWPQNCHCLAVASYMWSRSFGILCNGMTATDLKGVYILCRSTQTCRCFGFSSVSPIRKAPVILISDWFLRVVLSIASLYRISSTPRKMIRIIQLPTLRTNKRLQIHNPQKKWLTNVEGKKTQDNKSAPKSNARRGVKVSPVRPPRDEWDPSGGGTPPAQAHPPAQEVGKVRLL